MSEIFRQIIGVIIVEVFVILMLVIAEALRKSKGLSRAFTRKFVHVSVGNWVFFWPLFFKDWYFAMIPPLPFIPLNYVSARREYIKAIEIKGRGYGTVYYAFSCTLLAALGYLLNVPHLAAMAIMMMTWGDGLADIVGRRFGKHKYSIFGAERSLEGSLALIALSFVSSLVALVFFHAMNPTFTYPLLSLALASVLAGFIEALTPKGLDNITLPIGAFIILYFLKGV